MWHGHINGFVPRSLFLLCFPSINVRFHRLCEAFNFAGTLHLGWGGFLGVALGICSDQYSQIFYTRGSVIISLLTVVIADC